MGLWKYTGKHIKAGDPSDSSESCCSDNDSDNDGLGRLQRKYMRTEVPRRRLARYREQQRRNCGAILGFSIE